MMAKLLRRVIGHALNFHAECSSALYRELSEMTAPQIQIDPLTPAIGAEIAGVDLSRPLDEETQDALYRALIDHLVIFFRDQAIEPAAHLAFARTFGEPGPPHPIYPHVAGFENVMLLEHGPDHPPDTDDWHSDLTFTAEPPFASILCAREVPPAGGDTLWASMYAAYDALPPDMKSQISELSAVHDMGSFRNEFLAEAGGVRALDEAMARIGSALHPIVKRHPVTGRPYLYVNRSFTTLVSGMGKHDSDRLLNYLYDHLDRPEFQVRFRWQENSIAMWDNRVTQHYAVADYMPQTRCMHRVTLVEDRRAQAREPATGRLAV
jgi:taurine dioxygenase